MFGALLGSVVGGLLGGLGGSGSRRRSSNSNPSQAYINEANKWISQNLPDEGYQSQYMQTFNDYLNKVFDSNYDAYSQSTPATRIYQRDDGGIEGKTNYSSNPFLNQAGSYASSRLDPNYQAYSDDALERMYRTQAESLVDDYFKPQESRLAARLAHQGLSGSGTAQLNWGKQLTGENRALADLRNQMWQYGQEATRQDRSQAFSAMPQLANLWNTGQAATQRERLAALSMMPTFAGMERQQYYDPLNYRMQWLSLLQPSANRELQANLAADQQANQNAAGWATLLGLGLGGIF